MTYATDGERIDTAEEAEMVAAHKLNGGRTLAGHEALSADIRSPEIQAMAAKLAMWDEVVNALDDACALLGRTQRYEQIHGVLDRALQVTKP
jgi:hypothetical protein